MSADEPEPSGSTPDGESWARVSGLRRVVAAAAAFLLLAYLAAVVTGLVHQSERLTPSDLGVVALVLLVVAILLQPRLLGVVPTLIRVGSVEVQLQQLQRQQQAQRRDLDDLRLVLELLLTDWERQVLHELAAGKGSVHTGSEERRIQLRRLAGLKLIYRRYGRMVAELVDGERRNLAEIFELTDRGRSYLNRLTETNEPDT